MQKQKYSFYDARQHTGWLRNIIIRYCTTGELMLNVVINYEDAEEIKLLLDHLLQQVKGITTLLYTVNTKWNDSLYDQDPIVYFGPGYVKEKLEDLEFIISPKSFFKPIPVRLKPCIKLPVILQGLQETKWCMTCTVVPGASVFL